MPAGHLHDVRFDPGILERDVDLLAVAVNALMSERVRRLEEIGDPPRRHAHALQRHAFADEGFDDPELHQLKERQRYRPVDHWQVGMHDRRLVGSPRDAGLKPIRVAPYPAAESLRRETQEAGCLRSTVDANT